MNPISEEEEGARSVLAECDQGGIGEESENETSFSGGGFGTVEINHGNHSHFVDPIRFLY